jgi:hypothetical protein
MAGIEQRCSTLRSLAAKISECHVDFITRTFLREKQLCVSSSLQVLDDATFLVSAATIRIEPVSAEEPQEALQNAATGRAVTPPLGDTSLGLLKRVHTSEELDAKTEWDRRVPARSWKRWKAAEQGKAAFVGLGREKTHYAFVPCVNYAHAMNETTHTRSFGLPGVHVIVVCPSVPGASCSLAECQNGCTVWRVPNTLAGSDK